MNIKHKKTPGFGIWERHQKVFALIAANSEISARDLIEKAAQIGIDLSLSTAYRLLSKYVRSPQDASTKARKILPLLIDILKNLPEGEHHTAADLQNELKKSGNQTHISTIYRELKCLIEAKLILTRVSGRITYYEWHRNSLPHGHMVCSTCGHTTEFALDNLDSFAEPVSNRLGYSYSGCEFIIQGQCKNCLKAAQSRA
ncbi:MAG: transcriptional repressor [Candidatus Obscuribacterales bacterium]|nr:transcriptional repressor [Candidatus Obscuribacterales bacterium]